MPIRGTKPHKILSPTHSDALIAAVVRGDIIIGDATPKWSRLAGSGHHKFLRIRADGGVFRIDWAEIAFDEVHQTHPVTYYIGLDAALNNIVIQRNWQDETITPPVVRATDVPRNLQVTGINLDLMNDMVGTVTVNGLDADGATIQEVFTINVTALEGTETYVGNRAFAIITSIVADKTGSSLNAQYSVGVGDKIGFPNYPWWDQGGHGYGEEVFKVAVSGTDIPSGSYTVNGTYGTVDPSPVALPAAGVWMTVWYYVSPNMPVF